MIRLTPRVSCVLTALAVALLTACGGGGGGASTPTPSPAPSPSPPPTPVTSEAALRTRMAWSAGAKAGFTTGTPYRQVRITLPAQFLRVYTFVR